MGGGPRRWHRLTFLDGVRSGVAGVEDELIVVVPLSSSRAPSRLRPPVSPATGIDAESAAIPRAIRAVTRRRLLRRLGKLDPATLGAVERSLATVLGLDTARV